MTWISNFNDKFKWDIGMVYGKEFVIGVILPGKKIDEEKPIKEKACVIEVFGRLGV